MIETLLKQSIGPLTFLAVSLTIVAVVDLILQVTIGWSLYSGRVG